MLATQRAGPVIAVDDRSALSAITLDDLSDEQRQFAEIVGLSAYKQLIGIYGGTTVYIPKIDWFDRTVRNKAIREEFNGYNFKELGKKYGLTEVQIRNIVSDLVQRFRKSPIEGQERLF